MARTLSRFISGFCRQESGASAVEFALVLPIATTLLIGAIDIGGMAWTKMQVAAAARAGASYALTSGFNQAGISAAVTNATDLTVTVATPVKSFGCPDAATGIAVAADNSTPCADGAAPGNYAIVGASTSYNLVFGWPGLANPLPLTAETKVRIS